MAGGFVLSIASAVGSIGMLLFKIGRMIFLWRKAAGVARLAATAAEAATAATAAGAEGAAGGLAGIAGGAGGAAAASVVGGAAAMLYSKGLNTGERAYLATRQTPTTPKEKEWQAQWEAQQAAAQAATPGAGPIAVPPGFPNASVAQWAQRLNFAGTEARYKLPPGMLAAIAQTESQGNALATSRAGAQGLFQFMPGTAREYGINALDPAQSADAAARKMSGLLKRYNGNMVSALSAYNWGEGNLDRKGLANAPAETRGYAPKVLSYMPSLNSGTDAPSLNPPSSQAGTQNAPAPVVHVDNHVHVARDGSVTVRTRTPAGLKIARPMESLG
jgi:soluble lytic murein transglycosylase-like protein